MLRNFWKATLISLAVYVAAVLVGILGGFQYTLFIVPVFYFAWVLFWGIRIIQLGRGGGHKPDAPKYDRESYGFALGSTVSSTALLLVFIVLTQVV
jgi:hypothetical protein